MMPRKSKARKNMEYTQLKILLMRLRRNDF